MVKPSMFAVLGISFLFSSPLRAARCLGDLKSGKQAERVNHGVGKPRGVKIAQDIRLVCNKFCTYAETWLGTGKDLSPAEFGYYQLAKKLENKVRANLADIKAVNHIKYHLIKITDSCK